MSYLRRGTSPLLVFSLLPSSLLAFSPSPSLPHLRLAHAQHRCFVTSPLSARRSLPAASRLHRMPIVKMGGGTDGQDLAELFDVYHAPDAEFAASGEPRKTGKNKERGKVHRDGDWHRAVHVWLYTPQGEFVVQQRSEKKDTFPGKWDVSVGGHVTSGDSVMHTVIKETEEELGVDADEAQLERLATVATSLKGNSPKQGDFTCNEYKDIFLLKYSGLLQDLNFADNEVSDVKLIPWQQVEKDMLLQLSPEGEPTDGPYVPRPKSYIDLLFDAMRARFPAKVSK